MGRYVVPEMVATRYGPLSDDQADRVPWLIDDAEVEVNHQRDIPARIAAGDTSVDAVVVVVCELVNDALRNPLGLRSVSHTTGSFTDQQTFAGDPDQGGALTRRHRRLLGDRDGRRGTAYTIRPGGDR